MAAPVHQMNPFGDRGKVVGVYCIAKTPDGEILTDVMGIDDINKIRAAAKQDGVWAKWFEEMAKKAIIKRSSKQWPLGQGADRFHKAADIVNEVEGSESLEKDVSPVRETIAPAKQKISDERLITAIAKINSDEYSIERLNSTFDLTDEQHDKVMDAVKVETQ
jgi:recombinational DNA repair protein RecT